MDGKARARILLVDDDGGFRKVYGRLLRSGGFEVFEASTRPEAEAVARDEDPDLILLDLMLPPDGSAEGGLRQLKSLKGAHPETPVVVVSGAGDTRFMVQAVRDGAYDFLTKPVDPDVLEIVVQRALARAALVAEVGQLKASIAEGAPGGAMVGESAAFRGALSLVERVAPSEIPVLITGENGTGKELMARAVHVGSRRAAGPFVAVNCGALPEGLFESALFGHVKGAFTGATRDHPGLFAEADGGTLFLDEVGDMPLTLQVKVLRALESGEILPVGARASRHVDVRIVSATNRDLLALQGDGAFREDLYWRLKGVEVGLPPLRERPEDLPLLAAHFLNQARSLTPDGAPRRLSLAAQGALLAHPWPGNLRELRHGMQRATVLAGARGEILPEDLDLPSPAPSGPQGDTLQAKVEALERREIARCLAEHGGNRTHTASALGLSRQGLLGKIARYGLG